MSTFLTRTLWIDAATCAATGALLTAGAGPLAGLLGLPQPLLFWSGLALFPIAAFMAWLASRRELSRSGAWLVILGNAAWVLGSVLMLFVLSPSALGYAFVIVQALVVAALAELEYKGLATAAP